MRAARCRHRRWRGLRAGFIAACGARAAQHSPGVRPIKKQNTCDPHVRRLREEPVLAKAGTGTGTGAQHRLPQSHESWIPAFAGMTNRCFFENLARDAALGSSQETERLRPHESSPPRRRGPSTACRSRRNPGSPPPPARGQALRGDDEPMFLREHLIRNAGQSSSQACAPQRARRLPLAVDVSARKHF